MKKHNQTIHHAEGIIMGGPWQLRHVPKDGIEPQKVARQALAALESVNNSMSHFKAESDLMRFNCSPIGEWFSVPPNLVTVMKTAAEIHHFTQGALNIALGREISAWGFGADPTPTQCPEITAVANNAYEWQENPPALKRLYDVHFNLSALAKGFAVDLAARAVLALGIEDFLLEAAGEIVAHGERAKNMPWQVGLELPVPQKTLVYGQIALKNMAIASSGGYRKYHQIGDKTVIHTLNPQTGQPIESDLLSVSVLDPQCMRADALATALFVKGAAAGTDFADQKSIPALFLIRTDDGICEIRSQAWMDYLAKTGQLN